MKGLKKFPFLVFILLMERESYNSTLDLLLNWPRARIDVKMVK